MIRMTFFFMCLVPFQTWLISFSFLFACYLDNVGFPGSSPDKESLAVLVKNLPVVQETWVRSLSWKDPLENGTATHFSILAWRIPWTIYSPWGRKESNTTERLSLSLATVVSEIHSVWSVPWYKYWPLAAAALKNQVFLGKSIFTVTLLACFPFW